MKRRTALVGSLMVLAGGTSARADTPVDLQLVLAVDVSRISRALAFFAAKIGGDGNRKNFSHENMLDYGKLRQV